MVRGGAAITVVAVLADDALESDVGKDAGVGSCEPSLGISFRGCAPPDDVSDDDDDEGGGDGRRAAPPALAEERFACVCFVVFSDDEASSQSRRFSIWLCTPVNDAEPCLRGLAVGRGVWWDWASRSRDRLTDRLW